MTSQPSGGYPSEWFVNELKDEFICAICLEVLKNPHCCRNGHAFCLSCISKALKLHQECPTCKVVMCSESLMVGLCQRKLIEELTVKCCFCCFWMGPLHQMQKHVSTKCSFRPIVCPMSVIGCCTIGYCTGSLLRSELVNHVFISISQLCSLTKVNCTPIQEQIQAAQLTALKSFIDFHVNNGFIGKRLSGSVVFTGSEPSSTDGRHSGLLIDTGVFPLPKVYCGDMINYQENGYGFMSRSNGTQGECCVFRQ